MSETVLITGGAGFSGRFVCDELLKRGHKVRVLDSLIEQVHGDAERRASLADDIELIRADGINEAYERMLKGDVKYRFVIDTASLAA